jgi:hypothetical protein
LLASGLRHQALCKAGNSFPNSALRVARSATVATAPWSRFQSGEALSIWIAPRILVQADEVPDQSLTQYFALAQRFAHGFQIFGRFIVASR